MRDDGMFLLCMRRTVRFQYGFHIDDEDKQPHE